MDLKRKYPTTPNVMSGETQNGMRTPKLSRIMMMPRTEDRIHRAVFEVPVFFDLVDVPDGEFPDDECPDTVTDEMRGTAIVKANAPTHPVDGERGIDHFKVKDLADIRHVADAASSPLLSRRSAGTRGR